MDVFNHDHKLIFKYSIHVLTNNNLFKANLDKYNTVVQIFIQRTIQTKRTRENGI